MSSLRGRDGVRHPESVDGGQARSFERHGHLLAKGPSRSRRRHLPVSIALSSMATADFPAQAKKRVGGLKNFLTRIVLRFNFPAMIPLWAMAMATVTGNSLILKPSERDPGAAMILAELAERAGECCPRHLLSRTPSLTRASLDRIAEGGALDHARYGAARQVLVRRTPDQGD